MGLRKKECWRKNRSGTFHGWAFYLLFYVPLCLFVCIYFERRRLYFVRLIPSSFVFDFERRRLCFESHPLLWPAVYVGARIDLGLFLVALFLLPFLSCLSYFLTCVFLDLCIVLCLVLSDISPELNTGRSGETFSAFRYSPLPRVPMLNFASTVYLIDYR